MAWWMNRSGWRWAKRVVGLYALLQALGYPTSLVVWAKCAWLWDVSCTPLREATKEISALAPSLARLQSVRLNGDVMFRAAVFIVAIGLVIPESVWQKLWQRLRQKHRAPLPNQSETPRIVEAPHTPTEPSRPIYVTSRPWAPTTTKPSDFEINARLRGFHRQGQDLLTKMQENTGPSGEWVSPPLGAVFERNYSALMQDLIGFVETNISKSEARMIMDCPATYERQVSRLKFQLNNLRDLLTRRTTPPRVPTP